MLATLSAEGIVCSARVPSIPGQRRLTETMGEVVHDRLIEDFEWASGWAGHEVINIHARGR